MSRLSSEEILKPKYTRGCKKVTFLEPHEVIRNGKTCSIVDTCFGERTGKQSIQMIYITCTRI